MQSRAETRLSADVVVVGSGLSAVAAALAARAEGRRVLLASPGTAVADELTVALQGEFAQATDPQFAALRQRIAALGGEHDGWLDPAIAELVVDRVLAEQGVELLLYAVPLSLTTDGDRATGVLMAGKDGCYVLSAGAVVDATADGALFRNSGVAFEQPAAVEAARTVYLQFAGEDLAGLPDDVAGFRLRLRRTWPGEACLTLTGSAPCDGRPVPAELHRRARLAVGEIVAASRATVPGLAEAVVSHTGHTLRPLNSSRLATPRAEHPTLVNVTGAGGWVGGSGHADLDALAASGTRAGTAAAKLVREVNDVRLSLAAPVEEETAVAVVGGGTGGAVAALAAARQGAATTLLEAGWFLGGIGTGGGIHAYYHGVQGGLQDGLDAGVREAAEVLGGANKVVGFSPEAKKLVLEQAAAAAGVEVRYGVTVVDVRVENARVTGVVLAEPGRRTLLRAAAVVDATGDGDVAARAGAPFLVGRESDNLNHAYSQSAGRLQPGTPGMRVGFTNFDAGYVDATDVVDLTRARRHALQLYWKDEGFNAENRLLYVAPLLGLRQSRHVVGDYTLTLQDEASGRTFDDVVAYGKCHYDNHAFDFANESDEALVWCWLLGFWRRHMRHGVPYRSLLPRGIEGLVMGCRALSVSHDAHMLFRMQRDMQRVGEAAGAAAGLAAQLGTTPRGLDVAVVQAALRETGALLDEWDSTVPLEAPATLAEQLAGDQPHWAVWQLFRHGEAAVPALLQAVAGDDAEVRWWSAAALALLDHGGGSDVLLEALASRDGRLPYNEFLQPGQEASWWRVVPRWQAAMAMLGRLGDARAVPALTALLQQPVDHADLLLTAVRALGRLGDARAVPALEAFVERDDLPTSVSMQDSMSHTGGVPRDVTWQLRLAAADALNQLGAPLPELAEAYLDDPRAYVRHYAHRVLDEAPGARSEGQVEATDTAHLHTRR